MGLGGMFFLNLLGGAGRGYVNIKKEEREAERRKQELETQSERNFTDWKRQFDYTKLANDQEERDTALRKHNSYKSALELAGYDDKRVTEIMALDDTEGAAKDIALKNATQLKNIGVNPNDAYDIVPRLYNGAPMSNAPVETTLKLNHDAWKTVDPDDKFKTFQAMSIIETEIIIDEASTDTEIQEAQKRLDGINKAAADLRGDKETTEEPSDSIMKSMVATTMLSSLQESGVNVGLGEAIEVGFRGDQNLVIDRLDRGLKKFETTDFYKNNDVSQALINSYTIDYFNQIGSAIQPITQEFNNHIIRTGDTANFTLSDSAAGDEGKTFQYESFNSTGQNAHIEIFNFLQNLSSQEESLKIGSVVAIPSPVYTYDNTGNLKGIESYNQENGVAVYDYFYWSGTKFHELDYENYR